MVAATVSALAPCERAVGHVSMVRNSALPCSTLLACNTVCLPCCTLPRLPCSPSLLTMLTVPACLARSPVSAGQLRLYMTFCTWIVALRK